MKENLFQCFKNVGFPRVICDITYDVSFCRHIVEGREGQMNNQGFLAETRVARAPDPQNGSKPECSLGRGKDRRRGKNTSMGANNAVMILRNLQFDSISNLSIFPVLIVQFVRFGHDFTL